MGVGNMYKKKIVKQGRCRSVVKESKKMMGMKITHPIWHTHTSNQVNCCSVCVW